MLFLDEFKLCGSFLYILEMRLEKLEYKNIFNFYVFVVEYLIYWFPFFTFICGNENEAQIQILILMKIVRIFK